MSKDDVIRFRCEAELKERFNAIAVLERRDPADLARIVLEDYIKDKESRLNDLQTQTQKMATNIKKYPPLKRS